MDVTFREGASKKVGKLLLDNYAQMADNDNATMLADMVADLMHWAKQHKLDWASVCNRAEGYFDEENGLDELGVLPPG